MREVVTCLLHALLPCCASLRQEDPKYALLPASSKKRVISCPWLSSQIPGTEKLVGPLRVTSRCNPGPTVEAPVEAVGGAGRHPKGPWHPQISTARGVGKGGDRHKGRPEPRWEPSGSESLR